jgi:N-methylhydantoinase A/oxoprolinase/acetone carboxylase beta subunit
VHFIAEGLQGGVTLGPRRLLPVSLIATEAPDLVHAALDAQLRAAVPGEHDGRFLRAVRGLDADGLPERDRLLLERIGDAVQPVGAVLKTRIEGQALQRLVARGLVQVAGVTPSDASHMLGGLTDWDGSAAEKALLLFGRRRTGAGEVLARDPMTLAQMIVDRLIEQTVLALLETTFAEEGLHFDALPEDLARHPLMQRGLVGHRGLVSLQAGLAVDVIGLGASASSYYPAVGRRLNTRMILPEHAAVANAIGAVVGQVTFRRSGVVTAPSEGKYRVHLETGPEDFTDPSKAMASLETHLRAGAEDDARAAGAADIVVVCRSDIKRAQIESRDVFIEAILTVEASGRPRVAVDTV